MIHAFFCILPLQGFELVFWGDSITERWRGTEMGHPCGKGKDCPASAKGFKKHFGSYRTALLAISGEVHAAGCMRVPALLRRVLHRKRM